MKCTTSRFIYFYLFLFKKNKSYRSAILADLTLSIIIIERVFRIHFCVKLIPIIDPGDFSISIKSGPVEFLTLSIHSKKIFFFVIILYRDLFEFLPTIATSYSIRNRVVLRHCFIILYASCNVAPLTLIPFIANIRSPILSVPSL
jgi:hypothetical protein